MDGQRQAFADRGFLTVPDEVWTLAVRRAEVIGPLAEAATVGLIAADAAAAELGVSRRLIYVLVGRWRQGSGVVSDLVPGRSSGGRGREHLPDEVEAAVRELIRTHFLTRQKRTQAALYREVLRVCRIKGLTAPSRGSIARRIARMDPRTVVKRREGSDAARKLTAAGGPQWCAQRRQQADVEPGHRRCPRTTPDQPATTNSATADYPR